MQVWVASPAHVVGAGIEHCTWSLPVGTVATQVMPYWSSAFSIALAAAYWAGQPEVVNVLGSLPQVNEYVFSSETSEAGYFVGVSKPHVQACADADLPHVSLHGLRRSFATLSEWLEIPVGVVAQIQGHKPSAIAEKHYKRRPIDLLRMYHERLEAWILREANVNWSSAAGAMSEIQQVGADVRSAMVVNEERPSMADAFAR